MNKIVGKWNYKTQKYDDYNPPWKLTLMAGLNELVSCASCGTRLEFGRCYTSKEIHTKMGFGYPVCGECYQDERQRDEQAHTQPSQEINNGQTG